MNDKITKMARDIVVREAGLVDDPDDHGGITNHGVSLRYLRGKGLAKGDLNHDGVVDRNDIIECTVEQAVALFIEDFFLTPGLDRLPACLHQLMFDMAVMSGPGGSVKALQEALNGIGIDALSVDGGLGKQTLAASERAHDRLGDKDMIAAVVKTRIKRLYDIAFRDPSQRKYVVSEDGGKGGWIKRTESFL